MAQSVDLVHVVALLGAAVVAVPLFKRLGLGSVLGYLAAGVAIGPFGLRLFTDPGTILHTAELGVVMFLFIIGLEMRPSQLWHMRRDIFGLGSLQVGLSAVAVTLLGVAGINFIMGIPGSDDIMLNYQTTSFHDALYARQTLGLKPAPEFEQWLAKMGIFTQADGKVHFGNSLPPAFRHALAQLG